MMDRWPAVRWLCNSSLVFGALVACGAAPPAASETPDEAAPAPVSADVVDALSETEALLATDDAPASGVLERMAKRLEEHGRGDVATSVRGFLARTLDTARGPSCGDEADSTRVRAAMRQAVGARVSALRLSMEEGTPQLPTAMAHICRSEPASVTVSAEGAAQAPNLRLHGFGLGGSATAVSVAIVQADGEVRDATLKPSSSSPFVLELGLGEALAFQEGDQSLRIQLGAADPIASTPFAQVDVPLSWAPPGPCGGLREPCCAEGACDRGLGCGGETCEPCGNASQVCCVNDWCAPGMSCAKGRCR